jgi:hypothetical protein
VLIDKRFEEAKRSAYEEIREVLSGVDDLGVVILFVALDRAGGVMAMGESMKVRLLI